SFWPNLLDSLEGRRRIFARCLTEPILSRKLRATRVNSSAQSRGLGSLDFKKPVVRVYMEDVGSGAGTELARFRVTFDCRYKRIFQKHNSWYGETFEVDMSGMSFGPGYRISSVVKDSNKDEWHAVSSHGPERAHHLLMLDGSK